MKSCLIYLLTLLTAFWAFAQADTITLVRDHNIEVAASDSYVKDDGKIRTIQIGAKVYFEAKDNSTGLARTRLWVTDGTNQGTKVFDTFINSGSIADMELLQGKIIIFSHDQDGSSTKFIWELDPVTDKITLLESLPTPTYHFGSYSENTMLKINDSELLLVESASEFSIYNYTTKKIRKIKFNTAVNLGRRGQYFVFENHLFYTNFVNDPNQPGSIRKLHRMNLSTEEVVILSDGRLSANVGGTSARPIYEGKKYFRGNLDTSTTCYDLLSVDSLSLELKVEFSNFDCVGTKYLSVLGDALVGHYDESLVVKRNQEDLFTFLPTSHKFIPIKFSGQYEFVFKDGIYYFLANERETNDRNMALFSTDLINSVQLILLNDKEDEFENNWEGAVGLVIEDEELYLYTADSPKVSPSDRDYLSESRSFRVNLNDKELELIWYKDNFQIQGFLTGPDSDLFYVYSREIGLEPWKVEFSNDDFSLIKDINTDITTEDSVFFVRGSSPSRAYIDYVDLYSRYQKDYYNFYKDNEFRRATAVENEDTLRVYYDFRGIDSKYNYYSSASAGYAGTTLLDKVYDSQNELIKELTKYTSPEYIYDRTSFHKGDIGYLFTDIPSTDGDGRILLRSTDGDHELDIPRTMTRFQYHGDSLLVYGANETSNRNEFQIYRNFELINEFSLSCDKTCEEPEVMTKGSVTFITIEYEQKAINFIIDDASNIHREVFHEGSNLEGLLLVAAGDGFSLVNAYPEGANSIEKNIYRLEHSTGEMSLFLENDFLRTRGNNSEEVVNHASVGEFEVIVTHKGNVLVLNQLMNLRNSFPAKQITETTRNDFSYSGFFDCYRGYCYMPDLSSNSASTERLRKFDINGVVESEIEYSHLPLETLWNSGDFVLLSFLNSDYGREIFSLSIESEDSDSDGISDGYEIAYQLNPLDASDALLDFDGDGVTNIDEYNLDISPSNEDSDGDGINDGDEIMMGFNPAEYDIHLQDRDNDGLSYRKELLKGTEPLISDTDNDGVNDKDDAFPLDSSEQSDNDNDSIGDNLDLDDDNDGIPDSWEIRYGLDPLNAQDAIGDLDGDGIDNLREYIAGTDPTAAPVAEPPVVSNSGGGAYSWFYVIVLLILLGVRTVHNVE